MGAIAGIRGSGSIRELQRMTAQLSHRGRYSAEWAVSDNLLLGRRWGNPGEDGEEANGLHAVLDGIIDNRRQVMDALPTVAGGGVPNSDSELVHDIYSVPGFENLDVVSGVFAFAVLAENGDLVLGRDRVGYRRLYYLQAKDRVLFASEIKALLAVYDGPRNPDRRTLQYIHRTKHTHPKDTCLSNVHPVPPGETVRFSVADKEHRRYWKLPIDPTERTLEAHADCVRNSILEALDRKTARFGQIGVSLSGGLDSTVTVAGLRRLYPDRVIHTFTGGFGPDDEEVQGARRTAEHFDTVHHEVILSPTEAFELLPRTVWHLEEPIGREDTPFLFALAREAADKVDVLVGSYDADFLYGGMDRHLLLFLAHHLPFVGRPLKEILAYIRAGKVPEGVVGRALVRAIYGWHFDPPPTINGAPPSEVSEWTDEGDNEPVNSFLRHEILSGSRGGASALHQAFGLPMVSAYCDPDAMAAAFTVPDSLKTSWRRRKTVLRKAFAADLPEEMQSRSKTLQRIRRGPEFNACLQAWSERYLDRESVRRRGLVDLSYVERVRQFDEKDGFSDERAYRLWTLILTEIWARQVLDGDGLVVD